jgi:hypothetical protein
MDKTNPEHWMKTTGAPVWEMVETYASDNDEYSAALLSLRSRVELLEVARAVRAASSASEAPRSGDRLLPLLENAIACCAIGTAHEAALRCVADWLDRQGLDPAAFALRMELP